jgi:hypothetical protein
MENSLHIAQPPCFNPTGLPRKEDVRENDPAKNSDRLQARFYDTIRAQDQARQHNGDQIFNGPFIFQDNETAPAVAIVDPEVGRKRAINSLVFDQMDLRSVEVPPNLLGTCEWLLNTPEYKQWQDPSMMSVHHGFLWIKGKAGTGKSTLMKYAADLAEARSADQEHVLNFFFNARGAPIEASPDGLFRSILHQILEKIPHLHSLLDERKLEVAQRHKWPTKLLRAVFKDTIAAMGQNGITCYIDAMDECRHEDVEDIIRFFDDLVEFAVGQTRRFSICLSSRHYPNLGIGKGVELVLEHQSGHDNDIREYIRKRLTIDNVILRKHLAEVLEEKACGVFLWVVLVVALLNGEDRRGNAHDMHNRLDEIPTELSQLFDELLQRGTRNAYLRPLLQWVAFSNEPLSREELYCALLSEQQIIGGSGDAHTESEPFDLITPGTMEKFILESSKGMIELTACDPQQSRYSKETPRVQFIHESVRTYFSNDGLRHLVGDCEGAEPVPTVNDTAILERDGRKLMIARCYDLLKQRSLFYLMEHVWRDAELPAPLPDRFTVGLEMLGCRIEESFPFFSHAINNIFRYAEQAHNHGIGQQLFLDSLPSKNIGTLQYVAGMYYVGDAVPEIPTPWYMARLLAINLCPELLAVVLKKMPQSQAAKLQWADTLYVGLRMGNIDVIETTLRHRTDSDGIIATSGWRCLHSVIQGPNKDYVASELLHLDFTFADLAKATEEDNLQEIQKLLLPH